MVNLRMDQRPPMAALSVDVNKKHSGRMVNLRRDLRPPITTLSVDASARRPSTATVTRKNTQLIWDEIRRSTAHSIHTYIWFCAYRQSLVGSLCFFRLQVTQLFITLARSYTTKHILLAKFTGAASPLGGATVTRLALSDIRTPLFHCFFKQCN